MSTLLDQHHPSTGLVECESHFLVAREGTALAQVLRERGWSARAGWTRTDEHGEAVWYVRFERPERAAFVDEDACVKATGFRGGWSRILN